jgi:quinol monooxygenase YgiN
MCPAPAADGRPDVIREDLMGRFVIAVYRPKPGQEAALEAVVGKHLDVLRAEQLVTDRQAHVMRAKDGTVVEVFEWRSTEAIERAHANAAVQALWEEFGAACDYVPLASLPEAQGLFAEFDPVSVQDNP